MEENEMFPTVRKSGGCEHSASRPGERAAREERGRVAVPDGGGGRQK